MMVFTSVTRHSPACFYARVHRTTPMTLTCYLRARPRGIPRAGRLRRSLLARVLITPVVLDDGWDQSLAHLGYQKVPQDGL